MAGLPYGALRDRKHNQAVEAWTAQERQRQSELDRRSEQLRLMLDVGKEDSALANRWYDSFANRMDDLAGGEREDFGLNLEADRDEHSQGMDYNQLELDRIAAQQAERGLNPVSYTHLTLPTTPYV